MKKTILFFLMLSSLCVFSQTVDNITLKKAETSIRTFGGEAIVLKLQIDFTGGFENYVINPDGFNKMNDSLKFELKSTSESSLINNSIKYSYSVGMTFIELQISNINSDLITAFKSSTSNMYVTVNQPIQLTVWNGSSASSNKKVQIQKIQVENTTKQNPVLITDAMAQEYINSKGGEVNMIQNKFDFGLMPADESSSSNVEANATFSYRKRYSFLDPKIPIFFAAEGLISTNSKDSLNYVSVYPVNYNFFKNTSEFIGQVGLEGNQTFSHYRVTANFAFNTIIPNLINLTFGENRLRLKPVVKLGAKFYKEMKNNRPVALNDNKLSNQVFGSFYYYIPVHNNYSLILEANGYYDFNKTINPRKSLQSNYTVTFGLEVPKTKMKTMFKYSKGANGVTFQRNDYLIIGFLMDSFGIKK